MISLQDTLNEAQALSKEFLKEIDDEKKYKEITARLLELAPIIDDAISCRLYTIEAVGLIASINLTMNRKYTFGIQKLLKIIFNKHDSYTLLINPAFFCTRTFNEMASEVVVELQKIILNHPYLFKYLNKNNNENKHGLLERASSVDSFEILRSDIIEGRFEIKDKIKMPLNFAYTKSVMESEFLHNSIKNIIQKNENEYSFADYYEFILTMYDRMDKDNKNFNIEDIMSHIKDGKYENQADTEYQSIIDNLKKYAPQELDKYENESFENSEENDIVNETKNIVNQAYSNMTSSQKGNIPGAYRNAIDAILNQKPFLKWQHEFERGCGSIPSKMKYTKTRRSRRQPKRFEVSGTKTDYNGRAIVAIDTSGSMSDNMVKNILIEAYNISKKYHCELTVIECDSSIGKIYTVKKPKDINTRCTGGGGTSFTPVINYINNNYKKYKDAIVLYFTDGYGDSNIPKPLCKKIIWVITGAKSREQAETQLSVKNPYGPIRYLPDIERN